MKVKQPSTRGNLVPADNSTRFRLSRQTLGRVFLLAIICLASNSGANGQTTRTNRSAAPTSPSLPSSSSTSPNSPCDASNPTSPCFSAKAPGNPCYSAVGDPCSKTTTPASTVPQSQPAARPSPLQIRAITIDQARAAIEAAGYSKVEQLRKDAEGAWQGNAEMEGNSVSITLHIDGSITKN